MKSVPTPRAKLARRFQSEAGETLISVITSMLILSIAAAASTSAIMGFARASVDDKIIDETTAYTEVISNMITSELRLTGAGVPFTQSNFLITSAGIGTASLPILTTSDASSVTIRFNMKGKSSMLTAVYDPAAGDTFSVLSSTPFTVGETVYLSDGTAGGTNGFQATVSGVGANSVTVTGGSKIYNAGATFASGSLAQPVATVTYANSASGITRTENGTVITLYPGSTVSFQYYDSAGAAVALPLTAASISASLYSIGATVSLQSQNLLRSGSYYTTSLNNRVALRNINLTR